MSGVGFYSCTRCPAKVPVSEPNGQGMMNRLRDCDGISHNWECKEL